MKWTVMRNELKPFGVAFKEWAVVCAALASGRQSLILRKGGIQEGPNGFQAEHPEFWLYPTNFHQGAEALAMAGTDFLQAIAPPNPGEVQLRHLAAVEQVVELRDERAALALGGLHIWSDDTIRQRFHYRRPGLYLLVVRIYEAARPHILEETPAFAGCKTWVDLPNPLLAENPRAVLAEPDFQTAVEAVHARLA